MKTSARNEYSGTVRSVVPGAVSSEVVLDIGGDFLLTAVVTNESVGDLGLKPGSAAMALINPSALVVMPENSGLKTSARNCLHGSVAWHDSGTISGEVVMKLDSGQEMVAILTGESIGGLGLQTGSRICALIKSSQVILAVRT